MTGLVRHKLYFKMLAKDGHLTAVRNSDNSCRSLKHLTSTQPSLHSGLTTAGGHVWLYHKQLTGQSPTDDQSLHRSPITTKTVLSPYRQLITPIYGQSFHGRPIISPCRRPITLQTTTHTLTANQPEPPKYRQQNIFSQSPPVRCVTNHIRNENRNTVLIHQSIKTITV